MFQDISRYAVNKTWTAGLLLSDFWSDTVWCGCTLGPFSKIFEYFGFGRVSGEIFWNKFVSKTVYFQLKKPTYSDSNNKVAQISQVHIGLCVVALLGEAGPVANRSFCSHRQDRDGLNSSHLQGSSGSHSHKVSSVVVLTAGQLQLLTNWDLQENTV